VQWQEDFVWVRFWLNKQIRKKCYRSMKDLPPAIPVCAQSFDALSRASDVTDSVLN
jgi:hypothetical protein